MPFSVVAVIGLLASSNALYKDARHLYKNYRDAGSEIKDLYLETGDLCHLLRLVKETLHTPAQQRLAGPLDHLSHELNSCQHVVDKLKSHLKTARAKCEYSFYWACSGREACRNLIKVLMRHKVSINIAFDAVTLHCLQVIDRDSDARHRESQREMQISRRYLEEVLAEVRHLRSEIQQSTARRGSTSSHTMLNNNNMMLGSDNENISCSSLRSSLDSATLCESCSRPGTTRSCSSSPHFSHRPPKKFISQRAMVWGGCGLVAGWILAETLSTRKEEAEYLRSPGSELESE